MKNKNHSAAQFFVDNAKRIYEEQIKPFKNKPKSECPENYDKIIQRIKRNRRFAKEINKMKENH